MSKSHINIPIQLARQWRLLLSSLLLLLVWCIPTSFVFAQDTNTETETEQLCQVYHLSRRFPANVYEQPDNGSRVIGRVQPDVNLCVYGVSEENPDWYEINPDPDAPEIISGFIPQVELRVGEPGTIANPNIYCDAWQVRGNLPINVRSCPSTGCGVVTTRDPGEIMCIDDYDYSGGNWSYISQPGTINEGWVRSSQINYVFNDALGCPDNSYQITQSATLHSCTDATCATGTTLPVGTPVCWQTDSFEGATWVQVTEAEIPVGWIRIDLLDPLESDETLETVSLTQDVNFAESSVNIGASTDVETEPLPSPTNLSIGNNAQVVAQASTPTATVGEGTPSPTPLPPIGSSGIQVCPVGTNPVVAGQCVTVTPSPFGLTPQPGNGLLLAQNVSFNSLFIENIELLSPQGTAEFFFVLPDDWVVQGPVTLVLDIDYSENISSFTDEVDINVAQLSSRLDVRLDGVLASTLNLSADDVGRRQIEVILPTELLQDQQRRFHTVTLELNARDYCRVNAETRIAINSETSYMRAVYEEAVPALELSRYPVPFYNSPIGVEEEAVWFVLPNNPDDVHLQVASSVAAGLGRLTGNDLQINAVFASQVTNELYRNNNMILIGQPDRNDLIADLYSGFDLPTTLNAAGSVVYNGTTVENNEGVVQLAPNPLNPNKSVLVVTATSDIGLQQAGRALGGPPSLIGIRGDVAVITDATPRFRTNTPGEDLPVGTYRFSDFDIEEDIVLLGTGLKSFTFDFDVPIGGDVTDDAYIEVLFNATNSVNLETSTLNVLINDVPVSGVSFEQIIEEDELVNDDVDVNTVQVDYKPLRLAIPAGVIDPGQNNEIEFLVDLRGDWGCDLPNYVFASISRDSTIFLPQEGLDDDDYFPLVSQFPIPFNLLPNLQDVWISLPDQVSDVELEQLMRVMSYLGDSTPLAEGVIPTINQGELPTGTNLADYHFIVLGRPSQNAFLASINDSLPQPFFPGSDELVQEYDDITYRVGPGLNVGVLEILESPWNSDRVVFVMTGTSALGQEFASNALLDLAFGRVGLQGNIVFTSDIDSNAVDTRFVFNEIEILQDSINTRGQLIQPTATVTPTAVEVDPPTITPTIAAEGSPSAEANAIATGIFTQSPDQITPTSLPTLPPLPTQAGIFSGTTGGDAPIPNFLLVIIGVLGVVIVLVLVLGVVRAMGGRNNDEE